MASESSGDDPAGELVGAGRCRRCRSRMRWESSCDQWGERWLAVCKCGMVETFFPDRRHPQEQPPEPLVTYLQGHRRPRRPITPPWVRLFLNSLNEPYAVRWRHDYEPCARCEMATAFGMLAWPGPQRPTIAVLCLNCGYVVVRSQPEPSGAVPLALEGGDWSPPCLAVARLRECVYRAPHLAIGPDPD